MSDKQKILIEGCIDDNAREEISQMLSRRLAELDPEGLKAKFIMKLQQEINELPTCDDLIGEDAIVDTTESQE